MYWYKSVANNIATIWSKKAKKVQQKPLYALHGLLDYQTNPIPYVVIRIITGIMGLVWTYLLKIFLSLGVVITSFRNATVVLPLRLRHLKLEEPRTEIQPAQPSKPIEVLQNNKYDHHHRVRISGISESKEKSFIDRQFADKEKGEEVFKKLNVNCPIIETNRRGKFIEDRQRKLIATFSWQWDARLVISSAIQKKLFETVKILITTDLSPSDLAKERKLLSKRYELISNGVPKKLWKNVT